jgi:hypothetical protein
MLNRPHHTPGVLRRLILRHANVKELRLLAVNCACASVPGDSRRVRTSLSARWRSNPSPLLHLHTAGEFLYRRAQLLGSPRTGAVFYPHDDVVCNRMLPPGRRRFPCRLRRGWSPQDTKFGFGSGRAPSLASEIVQPKHEKNVDSSPLSEAQPATANRSGESSSGRRA